jgi:pyruvate/2-oxoglutarate dehydrogenase complex dihydrolipoamide acyltransferase (E2) component
MKVPAVGESITEVTISTWLKKDGDFVKLDEVIAEVESDKATFELPAEANGILRIVAKKKQTLPIGGLICKIEDHRRWLPATSKELQQKHLLKKRGDKNLCFRTSFTGSCKNSGRKRYFFIPG